MRVTKFISLVGVLVMVAAFAAAQEVAKSESNTTVKHVPINRISATSGKEMFVSYCAVCHGKDGKGDGPAAPAMKAVPADLTVLAQKNGGKYPSAHVAAVIRGQAVTPVHGTEDMPVWGPLFSSISQGHQGEVQQRVANLVKYVDTLQSK